MNGNVLTIVMLDVWVDIGNKFIGVQLLQAYLGTTPATTLHVGDQVSIYFSRYVSRYSFMSYSFYLQEMILRHVLHAVRYGL
jgi:hypothetical protein